MKPILYRVQCGIHFIDVVWNPDRSEYEATAAIAPGWSATADHPGLAAQRLSASCPLFGETLVSPEKGNR